LSSSGAAWASDAKASSRRTGAASLIGSLYDIGDASDIEAYRGYLKALRARAAAGVATVYRELP